MSSLERLGANIRSLRKAYGETQEELGAALDVEKNTVSYYENGKREPNKDMLTKIAKHFMVTIEELMYCDLSDIGSITVDNDAFWKNIDIILPIVLSEEALENEHFKKAYKFHRSFYDELRKLSMDSIEHIDVCFDEYLEAYEDEKIKTEAAVNLLALWNLMLMMVKTVPLAMNNHPAALKQVAARNPKVRQIIDYPNSNFEKDAQEAAVILDDPEIREFLDEMKTAVKRSYKWADLADYYLALQYIWNIVDNEMGWGFNCRVGVEMLNAFVSVGNVYANRFLKYSLDSIGLSSQTVDDR